MVKKSRIKLLLSGCVTIALSVLVYGCPKPTAEMKRAEGAIKEAKAAGASEYAPQELRSAEVYLDDGKKLMDQWSYKKARAKFEDSYQMALTAKQKALAAQQTCPDEPVTTVVVQPPSGEVTSHTVVKGECLWWIAEYDQIYGDPFQWPLIYWENQSEIDSEAHRHGKYSREEDLIFPGQEFSIPRNNSMDNVKKARRNAGAPAPYTPPGN